MIMARERPKLKTESDWRMLRRNWLLVGVFLLQCFACFFVPMFLEMTLLGSQLYAVPACACLGVIASQIVILGFVFTMFPSSVMVRLSLAMGGIALSVCLLFFGSAFWQSTVMHELIFVAGWVPMLLVGASLPFLVTRAVFGWTVSFENEAENDPRVTVSSMLIGTGLIAFSLTLLMTGNAADIGPAMATSIAVAGAEMLFFVPLTFVLLKSERVSTNFLTLFAVGLIPGAVGGLLGMISSLNAEGVLAFSVMFSSLMMAYGMFIVAIKDLDLVFKSGFDQLADNRARSCT